MLKFQVKLNKKITSKLLFDKPTCWTTLKPVGPLICDLSIFLFFLFVPDLDESILPLLLDWKLDCIVFKFSETGCADNTGLFMSFMGGLFVFFFILDAILFVTILKNFSASSSNAKLKPALQSYSRKTNLFYAQRLTKNVKTYIGCKIMKRFRQLIVWKWGVHFLLPYLIRL